MSITMIRGVDVDSKTIGKKYNGSLVIVKPGDRLLCVKHHDSFIRSDDDMLDSYVTMVHDFTITPDLEIATFYSGVVLMLVRVAVYTITDVNVKTYASIMTNDGSIVFVGFPIVTSYCELL